MLKNILAALCISVLVVGCGSGSGGGANGGGSDVGADELGYSPSSRWPEKGDYSYNFDVSVNGARCVAKKEFNNKADYCIGLQDETLNKGCAQSARERSYSADCGNDFQPINFSNNYWRSGFDSRLQKRCETGRPSASMFKTMKQYCEFLKDESLHKECFWDDRLDQFQDQKCQGPFSGEPAVAVPPVTPPTPQPTPTPGQPGDALDMIPVVRALRSQGIEVEVDWQSIRRLDDYPTPGDLPEQEQFKVLWQELSDNLTTILAHKKVISKIDISIYTHYRTNSYKEWTLNYRTNRGDLANYFPLFDKLLENSATLNINFDMIHSTSARGVHPYTPLVQMISAVEGNWKLLTDTFGLIKEIDLDSYTHYSTISGRLTLDRNKVNTELSRLLTLLKPLGPFYTWAANSQVKIDVDYDIEKETDKVHKVFAILQKSLPDLDSLAIANKLDEIRVYISDSSTIGSSYFDSSKKILLAVSLKSPAVATNALQCLAKMVHLEAQLQVPVKMFMNDLNEDFNNSVFLLEKVLGKVKAKIFLIDEISVGYETSYYSKKLRIGAHSTLAQTEDVIAKIK